MPTAASARRTKPPTPNPWPTTSQALQTHIHTRPPLTPQDEITNGLDSSSALAITRSLRNICKYVNVGGAGAGRGGCVGVVGGLGVCGGGAGVAALLFLATRSLSE